MNRRDLLRTFGGATLAGAMPAGVRAQSYPSRPIKLVIGFGAGGNGDVTMRIVAEKLAARLGQAWVVENRPGAGGIAASQAVLQAPADGYTLMVGASSNIAMVPSLFKSLSFDPAKDFVAVGLVCRFGFLLAVNGKSRLRTLGDLLTEAKAKPGTLNIGCIAVGSAPHIGVELFKAATGADLVTVTFKNSGEVIAAARANTVDVVLDTIPPLLPQFQGEALRPLAMTSAERFPGLPNVPTVREAGIPFEFMSWNGIVAPRGTPEEALDRLDREVRAVLQLPDVVDRFRSLGVVPAPATRHQFQTLIESEIVAWRRMLEIAKIPKT